MIDTTKLKHDAKAKIAKYRHSSKADPEKHALFHAAEDLQVKRHSDDDIAKAFVEAGLCVEESFVHDLIRWGDNFYHNDEGGGGGWRGSTGMVEARRGAGG